MCTVPYTWSNKFKSLRAEESPEVHHRPRRWRFLQIHPRQLHRRGLRVRRIWSQNTCCCINCHPPTQSGDDYLLYPVIDLRAQPVRPLVYSLAVSRGDGNNFYIGVELFCVTSARFKIKVKIRHNVYLVYKKHIAYREHQRIFKGLVVSLGDGEGSWREWKRWWP